MRTHTAGIGFIHKDAKCLIIRMFKHNFAPGNQQKIIDMKGILKFFALASVTLGLFGCSSKESKSADWVKDEGLIRNDDLVVERSNDGRVTIKNGVTGKVTIKDIKLDWRYESRNDSLSVFCSEKKRGYYNVYTGEIVVPAQYSRAWIFSDGLAGVQKNGMIGFIDHSGKVVIDFKFPYHGNPLSEYVFLNGYCAAADTLGRCGIINKKGEWVVAPEYDSVTILKEYAIVSSDGIRRQVAYDGTPINSFVVDSISRLEYKVDERVESSDGRVQYVRVSVDTGLFSYRVGGRSGLMDANCHRITEPIYYSIIAVDKKMFRAILLDGYSEVILNANGKVMQ